MNGLLPQDLHLYCNAIGFAAPSIRLGCMKMNASYCIVNSFQAFERPGCRFSSLNRCIHPVKHEVLSLFKVVYFVSTEADWLQPKHTKAAETERHISITTGEFSMRSSILICTHFALAQFTLLLCLSVLSDNCKIVKIFCTKICLKMKQCRVSSASSGYYSCDACLEIMQ